MRFQNLMASKRLEVNMDKSAYILIGKKKTIERVREEIERKPIMYNNMKMKEKKKEKWLGDIIDAGGNKASTLSTIKERKTRIINAINETIAIIEDSRINRLGS